MTIKRKYYRGVQFRYTYRLYPTPGQRDALARAFGCARVVFNDGLHARQEAYAAGLPYITDAELSARLTAAKATPERTWLGEVSSVVLQQALADLNAAYRNFFASLNGNRKGAEDGLPEVPVPQGSGRKKTAASAASSVTQGRRKQEPRQG
jgi:putative transposase